MSGSPEKLSAEQIETLRRDFAEEVYVFGDSSEVVRVLLAHADALQAENEALRPLREALSRVTHNFRLLVAGKPVRDVAETLAEADNALSESSR